MPICNKCNQKFPNRIKIDGITKIICNRKYCLDCSPFNQHNTRKIEKYGDSLEGKRYCSDCRQPKIVTDFYRRKNGGFYSCCKICQNRKSDKQKETKLKCVDYKGGKCQRCGYNRCIQALDFHHVSDDKKFGISTARNRRFEDLKVELDKCVLVCAICHRELHAGLWSLEDLRV